jgi:gamma-glutamyl hercynylcysteine S-oxide hydrolase
MCRWMAYAGPPASLERLVLEPTHSLLNQSYRPRFQRHGSVNADGFGCGWFEKAVRPEPALYRSDKPIWSDQSFASIAGLVSSKAVLASVRDATPGYPVEASSTAPFSAEGWLFAHNGTFDGFGGPAGLELKRKMSDKRAAGIRGTSDSEVLFALLLDGLDEGLAPRDALRRVISQCLTISTGRFNLVLHDGWQITATSCGDSMFYLEDAPTLPGAVVVASEPFDEAPEWQQVPESSLVEAYCGGVVVTPLKTEAR